MATAVERLAAAIGYPERVPDGATSYTFRVDDDDLSAYVDGGRLVLSQVIARPGGDDAPPGLLETLTGYAVGRILKEEAILAYDPEDAAVILWQSAPADATPTALRRLFESFSTSCDWWRERVEEQTAPKPQFPEILIRP